MTRQIGRFRPLLGFFISNREIFDVYGIVKYVFVPYWGSLFLIHRITVSTACRHHSFRPLLGFFISNPLPSQSQVAHSLSTGFASITFLLFIGKLFSFFKP